MVTISCRLRILNHTLRHDFTDAYEPQIRQQVEADPVDQIVAIDIETGAFEVDEDNLAASDRLLARCPDTQTWFIRIGHRGVQWSPGLSMPEGKRSLPLL